MTKDGLSGKLRAELRRAYDAVTKEPVPEDMKALVERMG